MGKGLLAVCFVGACPAAKGVHREVRYSHKGCACDLLQKELCEAHLHRRAIAIAHQKQDTEDPEEEGHADDQASQEDGEFCIHLSLGICRWCRQEACEPRVFRACHGFALRTLGRRLTTIMVNHVQAFHLRSNFRCHCSYQVCQRSRSNEGLTLGRGGANQLFSSLESVVDCVHAHLVLLDESLLALPSPPALLQ